MNAADSGGSGRRIVGSLEAPTPSVSAEASNCGQVFLISPIGTAESKDREHANLAYRLLLEPAGKRVHSHECMVRQAETAKAGKPPIPCAGFKIERADHRPGSGVVMQKVAHDIARCDVVVALLTGIDPEVMNANVMYELGIAHSAARTVVILRREGAKTDLPFDIKHFEATPYTLDPERNREGEQEKSLAQAISVAVAEERKARLEATDYAKPIFAWGVEGLDPLGVQYRNLSYYQSFTGGPPHLIPVSQHDLFQSVKQPDLVKIYKRSRKRILLIDPQPEFYLPELKAFPINPFKASQIAAIVDAAKRGVQIDVLVTDPDHDLLTEMMPGIGESRLREHGESVCEWKKLAEETVKSDPAAKFNVYEISNYVLPQRVLATDLEAVVVPRFYGVTQSGRGPCLQLSSTTKFFKEIHFDADKLIEAERSADKRASGARPLSVKPIGKLDVITELNRTSSYAYWLNPPFAVDGSRPSAASTQSGDDAVSWEFVNVVLGLSIRAEHKREVVIMVHSPEAVAALRDVSLQQRLDVSADIWSRYVDAAQQHGGRITFSRIAPPVRLESILLTEFAAIILPLNARLDLNPDARMFAQRISGGTVQHSLLLQELRRLAGIDTAVVETKAEFG